MSKLIEQSKEYFKSYKDVDTFYATTDGQFFVSKSNAYSHQVSLNKGNKKGAKPTAITRDQAEGKTDAPADDNAGVTVPEGTPDKKWKVAEIQAYLTAKEIPFETDANKAALLELAEAATGGDGDDGDDDNKPGQ